MTAPVAVLQPGMVTIPLKEEPKDGQLVGRKVVDLESGTMTTTNLNQIASPDAGFRKRLAAFGCCGGMIVGAIAGIAIAIFALCEIWGVGTGLWVEGKKQDKQDLVLAGRIMVLYVFLPLLGCFGLCGAIAGCTAGTSAGCDD